MVKPLLSVVAGSPPRVWGKRDTGTGIAGTGRFTPTCVGKTAIPAITSLRLSVHPHVCGENPYKLRLRQINEGSPPRVWGKRMEVPWRLSSPRFTPTCVGKTR